MSTMHPKAALLALAGLIPVRHREQMVGHLGFRVGSLRDPAAPMLYLQPGSKSGIGRAAGLNSYQQIGWNDTSDDQWDNVTDEMIQHLLGEIYEN